VLIIKIFIKMLCSRCYKKIPEGEEVAKTTGYFKVNGWGRWGAEIYCKRCALWQDKKDRAVLAIFFMFPFIMLLGFIVFFVWKGTFPLYTLLWLIPSMAVSAWFVWFDFPLARKNKKKKKKNSK
jgi:fatty acid desaturase